MEERFLKTFHDRLKEKGIDRELPPDIVKWQITEKKRVKRHKAVAFRLSDCAANALTVLARSTKASKTEIIEKLILVAETLMHCPEWEEVGEQIYRERRDIVTVETVRILPRS